MRSLFRSLFAFLLAPLESGSQPYSYKASHRYITVVVGVLFSSLAAGLFFLAQGRDPGYLFPVLVFGVVGVLAIIVGLLGDDRAVAKIWGNQGRE